LGYSHKLQKPSCETYFCYIRITLRGVFIKLLNKKEITMMLSRLGHWVRVVVMFLTGGFIFPHAMTEGMDVAKSDADKDAKVKKQ
jgi:hypothetical protein